jgi:NADH:ubiquinone oxidoreductase subunit F (NADH-binding)
MIATRVASNIPHLAPGELPRVLPRERLDTLDAHLEHFGPVPRTTRGLIDEIERAGLRGHGGASFPTATKMGAVAKRLRRGVVVVNATEGEPMSSKDQAICALVPHLMLDGAVLAAEAVGAGEAIVCVDRERTSSIEHLQRALGQRRDRINVQIRTTPTRYVAGEESALVHWLNGGEAKPTFVPPRPFERGVGGRPTLVQNAETLAHVALIARFGANWFRTLGTQTDPGSSLVTVSGAVARPGVYEIPFGMPVATVLAAAGGSLDDCQALLVGGYFGTWLPAANARALAVDPSSLRAAGASFGCGVLFALPRDASGLAESAAVARWLAGQSAGQCGPCVFGLPAIAHALTALANGDRNPEIVTHLQRWVHELPGRGACKLPDGAAHFVASAIATFGTAPTSRAPARWLATPAPGGWR